MASDDKPDMEIPDLSKQRKDRDKKRGGAAPTGGTPAGGAQIGGGSRAAGALGKLGSGGGSIVGGGSPTVSPWSSFQLRSEMSMQFNFTADRATVSG